MRKRLLTAIIASGITMGAMAPPAEAARRYRTPAEAARHRRHMKTAKRVGIGAAGGAAIGALAGHGTGAAIGAAAGAGAGALYDRHKRHQRRHR